MDVIEKRSIRESFTKLTYTIDPLYIRGFLYEKGALSGELMKKLSDIKVRTSRAEELILHILADESTCTFSAFLEALNKDRIYSFLVQELEAKVDEIKRRKDIAELGHSTQSATDSIPDHLRRVNIHTRRHAKVVKYRHQLKQYCMSGKTDEFVKLKHMMLQLWKTSKHKHDVSISIKQEYADLYFYALDSEMEFRTSRYDITLARDCVFKRMMKIIHHTTHPKLSSMMYFARRASSKRMGGKSVEKCLNYLRFAKEHGDSLTPCRETGIVLIIEYNLLCHVYEKNPSIETKNQLLKLARDAIEHFDREKDEDMSLDFRGILLLKIIFIYLGIGIFEDYINGVDICENDLIVAKSYLKEVEQEDQWSRIESHWLDQLMMYHMACSRIHQLEDRKCLAYEEAVKAHDLASRGGFQKEMLFIESTIEEMVMYKGNESSEDNVLKEFEQDYMIHGPNVTENINKTGKKRKMTEVNL